MKNSHKKALTKAYEKLIKMSEDEFKQKIKKYKNHSLTLAVLDSLRLYNSLGLKKDTKND